MKSDDEIEKVERTITKLFGPTAAFQNIEDRDGTVKATMSVTLTEQQLADLMHAEFDRMIGACNGVSKEEHSSRRNDPHKLYTALLHVQVEKMQRGAELDTPPVKEVYRARCEEQSAALRAAVIRMAEERGAPMILYDGLEILDGEVRGRLSTKGKIYSGGEGDIYDHVQGYRALSTGVTLNILLDHQKWILEEAIEEIQAEKQRRGIPLDRPIYAQIGKPPRFEIIDGGREQSLDISY